VKAKSQNGGLKLFWSHLIHKREKIVVKEVHLTGSFKLLCASGKRNVHELLTNGTILPIQTEENNRINGTFDELSEEFIATKIAMSTSGKTTEVA
ncbi:11104_t:CDS:2, partial [Dentiscutata erythropus]